MIKPTFTLNPIVWGHTKCVRCDNDLHLSQCKGTMAWETSQECDVIFLEISDATDCITRINKSMTAATAQRKIPPKNASSLH